MKAILIPDDNLVIIDGEVQRFSYTLGEIHAIHWNNSTGDAEYKDGSHVTLNDTSLFNSVINDFISNKTTIDSAEEIKPDVVEVKYKSGEAVEKTRDVAIQEGISFNELSLEKLKQFKAGELKQAFNNASIAPVAFDGVTWNGGIESAMMLNGHSENMSFKGRPVANVHDVNNVAHQKNAQQIKAIASEIADAYQVEFEKYQALKRQVNEATTTEAVRAITYA